MYAEEKFSEKVDRITQLHDVLMDVVTKDEPPLDVGCCALMSAIFTCMDIPEEDVLPEDDWTPQMWNEIRSRSPFYEGLVEDNLRERVQTLLLAIECGDLGAIQDAADDIGEYAGMERP
jgi:hypothetical protein